MGFLVIASLVAYVWFFAGVVFWRAFTRLRLGFEPRGAQRHTSS